MDTTDLKILRFLQDRPEASVSYLAEKIGLSQTPCWRRIKKLEDDGVISGRAVILDPKSLGIVIDVVAHLKVARQEEETLEALEAEVQTHPEIVECFSMSGESDYMLRRSEEHTSELQSRPHLVCRLLLEKKKKNRITITQ